jgi:hypothetical protein
LASALRRRAAEDPSAHALLVAAFCGRPIPLGRPFPPDVKAALGTLLRLILAG